MKTLRNLSACAAAFVLTACASTPNLLAQNAAGTPPSAAKQILIVLDGKDAGSPMFGTQGHAYLTGMGQALQNALRGVPTRIILVDSMMLASPVPAALQATRPSHTILVFPFSNLQRNGFPISAVWQMEVSAVTITPTPAAEGKPSGTQFTSTPIYKARAEGDTCLRSDGDANECGAAMGKLLGETLRAAHVVQLDSES